LYITKAIFKLVPMDDLIIPPFSTKVSNTLIVMGLEESSSLLDEVRSKTRYKRLVLSSLFSGSKPLIKLGDSSPHPLTLFRGRLYWFSVVV